MRRLFGTILFGALTSLVYLPLQGGVASASPYDCPSTYFCAWTSEGYAGTIHKWENADNSWPSPIRNNDQSAYNHGTSSLYLRSYTSDGYTGTVIVCLPRGWEVSYESPENNGQSHIWSGTMCSNPGPQVRTQPDSWATRGQCGAAR